MHEGSVRLQDQIREYVDRHVELDNLNYLEYFLNTYDVHEKSDEIGSLPKRHDWHARLPYLAGTPHEGHVRVIRQTNHNTIPHIPGPWFPRSDESQCHALYCASVLALLKPWRNIIQLKRMDETFDSAFESFMSTASSSIHDLVDNMQYFHECADKAKEHGSVTQTMYHGSDDLQRFDEDLLGEEEGHMSVGSGIEENISEEDIVRAADGTFGARERLYADVAMNIAEDYGFFSQDAEENLRVSNLAEIVTDRQWESYLQWDKLIKNATETPDISSLTCDVDVGRVEAVQAFRSVSESHVLNHTASLTLSEESSSSHFAVPEYLNEKQRLAFGIVYQFLGEYGLQL